MSNETFALISKTQAAYARCIDEGPLDQWPDFFVEDCFYQITTAENYRQGLEAGIVWADSRGMLVDRISALNEANIYERHVYRHILGQPLLGDETDQQVSSETPFLVVRVTRDGASDLFATGRYLDRYWIEPGRARLVSRIAVCDSSQVDTLLALPL